MEGHSSCQRRCLPWGTRALAVVTEKWARQYALRSGRYARPPSDDQATHRALTQPRRTLLPQQLSDGRKPRRQGRHEATEIGHRGSDIDRTIDADLRVQRDGTHLTVRIGQKHTGLDGDVTASTLERI